MPLEVISTAPEKQDQTAIYYCPFCMTEYRENRHNCIDCEVGLKEFDKERRGLPLDPYLDIKS